MSAYVVYIDHSHAKLFKFTDHGVDTLNLEHEVKTHGHESQGMKDKVKDASKLYHDVALKLSGASEILVVGHGTAKDQFVHHLKEHKHQDLAKKVVGVESVDHPTDKQIIAMATKVFRREHLYKS